MLHPAYQHGSPRRNTISKHIGFETRFRNLFGVAVKPNPKSYINQHGRVL